MVTVCFRKRWHLSTSLHGAIVGPEDGDSIFLRNVGIYRRVCTVPSSVLKMETACFSETLAYTDESTRRQTPEHHYHPHRRESLKSHVHSICLNFKTSLTVFRSEIRHPLRCSLFEHFTDHSCQFIYHYCCSDWQDVGENCIMRSCIACTLQPVLLVWWKQGGWHGRGMWRAWGRWGVHTTFWLGGLKGGDH
jgi:hypothetical protein